MMVEMLVQLMDTVMVGLKAVPMVESKGGMMAEWMVERKVPRTDDLMVVQWGVSKVAS